MKGPKMKPSLGRIKSDDGLGEILFKKRKGKKKGKKGGKKRKLHKIEHGFGDGFDSWAFSAFFPLVENNFLFFLTFFFFLRKSLYV